eukprot:9469907-Pyramimonas_sp.AAC.1
MPGQGAKSPDLALRLLVSQAEAVGPLLQLGVGLLDAITGRDQVEGSLMLELLSEQALHQFGELGYAREVLLVVDNHHLL